MEAILKSAYEFNVIKAVEHFKKACLEVNEKIGNYKIDA